MYSFLNKLKTGICILNEKGKVIFANEKFKEWFGEIQENKPYYEVIKSLELISFIHDIFSENKTSGIKLTFKEKIFEVEAVEDEGKIFIIVEDITEREKLSEFKENFVVNLAHEIKTPLSVVSLTLETLKEELKGKEDLINRALKRLRSIEELVKNVYLIFYEGNQRPNNVNIEEVVKEITQDFSEEIKEKEIEIVEDYKDKFLKFNPESFKIILRNVIENAVKFNKIKGKIYIRTHNKENFFVIEIEDTGYGIDNAHIPFIFEPFFKGERSKGLGIGLYIVKKIIEKNKGKIEVYSEKNKGTKVIIKLHSNSSFS